MSRYTAEPVPAAVEPELAEFIDRQLNLIAMALQGASNVAIVRTIPNPPDSSTRKVAGGFVNVNQKRGENLDYSKNGLWGCMYNHLGELEWKRYLPQSN